MILVAARLRDDVDDAADRLTVLRFKAAGLYLNFLDERRVDTGSQRAIRTREGSDTTERGVSDVYTVGDVKIVECRTTGD